MTYEPVIFAMLMYAVIRINFKQFVDFQACDFGWFPSSFDYLGFRWI